ncbi:MAG: HAMP domain-containing sensor histidine kinase [Planctomycetota bacterium]|nr:HAMP domain-containing sensor histidine kinase [Planctomycetota bacterium]
MPRKITVPRAPSLPLRLKFTLWSLVVFLIVYLATSGTWFIAQNALATSTRDRRMQTDAMGVVDRVVREAHGQIDADLPRRIGEELARTESFQGAHVLLRAEDGTIEARAGDSRLDDREFPVPDPARSGEVARIDVPIADGTLLSLRSVAREYPAETGARYWIQVVVPADSDSRRDSVAPYFLIGIPIGVIAAAAMAWIMAGRLVRPIQRMATAARAVSPTNLRGRIDVDPTDSEIARLQQEWNAALERVEKGYRAQGMFLSNVSHELKTPIAVLLSQAQVIRQGGDPEELASFARNVEEEMRTMARLVESLLLLARVEHGKELVRRENVAVNDVILEAAERTSELARSLDVPLVTNLHLPAEGESEPELVGDPELLRTMVENLVRNALRFTPRGMPVDLRVTCGQGEASIRVRDRGPGIPREHIERIFERFYQVPGEGAKQRGTGLGLAIARSVAELHRGVIAVRNLEDRGCEFEVRLPLVR